MSNSVDREGYMRAVGECEGCATLRRERDEAQRELAVFVRVTGGPRVAQQIAAEYEARIRADERSKRPSRERVRELVGELLEAEARAGKAVSGELEFSYAHADLREALNTLLDECCGPLREGE